MDIYERIEKEATRRRYSPRTIKTYQKCAEVFFRHCGKVAKKVTKKDIREFLEKMADKDRPGNTINVYLNALKFVFEELLGKKMQLNIRYSKRPVKLPVVLSKEEIKKLFDSIQNDTHRLMIRMMYSAGLRVSELINLKIQDLEIEQSHGWVRGGKGNKDRLFVIADSLKDGIKEMYKNKDLEDYLFVSNRGTKYNIRSLQEIIKKACKHAGIKKRVGCHTLRHSFATHLIENGCSLGDVQLLLGHRSPETTLVYLHTAASRFLNVKSPIDSL